MNSRSFLSLIACPLVLAFQLNATSNQNLGYSVSVSDPVFTQEFAGVAAAPGKQWCVLQVSLRNRIDPFLVFDYGVEETINILNLTDRFFLVSGDGGCYRLNPGFLGVEGHFGNNLKLERSGSKVEGLAVFEVADGDVENLELHVIDEYFAPVVAPVSGSVGLENPPAGSTPLENKQVSLAVGDHGEINIEGEKPKEGRIFYFVDLWGKSKYKRSVQAYYIDEEADPSAMADADFYFEYKKSDLCLNLVVNDSYAFAYTPELTLGVEVYPAFVSEKWTKTRLIFEMPKDGVDSIKLEALFGKMGLSEGEQIYLNGLVFDLKKGKSQEDPPSAAVKTVDTKKPNELTATLALLSDLSPLGIDNSQWVGLWVNFENTGSEPGALDPLSRLWFDGGKAQIFANKSQPENPWAPPKMLFLDPGHPRSYVILYPKSTLAGIDGLKLCYSGIGCYEEFEADLDASTLSRIAPETKPAKQVNHSTDGFSGTTEAQAEKKGKSTSVFSDSSADTSWKPSKAKSEPEPEVEVEVPEIKLEPYKAERPPEPYHEAATAEALAILNAMANTGFANISDATYAMFEENHGSIVGSETEPNDEWEQASRMLVNKTFSGALESKGLDYWKISVPATSSDEKRRYDLLVSFPTESEAFKGLYCTLYTADETQVIHSWMETQGSYPFRNLKLAPGDYVIRIQNYGDQPESPYLLQLKTINPTVTLEAEPNGWQSDYLQLEAGVSFHGVVGNRDHDDYYVWNVSEEDSEKRFDILVLTDQPEHEIRMFVYDEEGEELYWKYAKDRFSMGDFSPAAGTYFIQLNCREDKPTRYQLKLQDRGYHIGGWEREPNDVMRARNIVAIESFDDSRPELLGRLEGRYGDFFAINIKDTNSLYHVTVTGPERLDLSYHDVRRGRLASTNGRDGNPAFFVDLRLPLGLNYFNVDGSEGDYAVNVQQVPIPGETFEWEPNDSQGQAKLIQTGVTYQGRLLSNQDDDWFRLVVHQAMPYRFRLVAPEGSKMQLAIVSKGFSGKRQYTSDENTVIDYEVELLPGDYAIKIEAPNPSTDFYDFSVNPAPTAVGLVRGEISGLSVVGPTEPALASAFNDDFQVVKTSFELRNESQDVMNLKVRTATTHWKVQALENGLSELSLRPGESKTIDVEWLIQPQLSGNEDVNVFLGLEKGGIVEFGRALIDLSPEAIAERILPGRLLLDDAIAGGLNLNASALGAVPVMEPESLYGAQGVPSENYLNYLIDGVLANRSFWGHAAVIQMVGDGKTPIVSSSIELHGGGSLWESARDFSIDVSDDGNTFTEVYSGTLEPRTGDQHFVFPKPVTGKFARLRIHNTQSGKEGQKPHLGEWRMIAKPTVTVAGIEEVDLLKKENGGHWIHGDEQSRVYGFQHNRAARVKALVWRNKNLSTDRWGNVHEVKVDISEDSPVGPWKTLGSFDVSAADIDGNLTVSVPIEGSPLVRFVKFSWGNPEHANNAKNPESIGLIELDVSENYRSAIGEWKGPTQFAYPEYLEKRSGGKEVVELKRIDSSMGQPYALEPEKWVNSVAWINKGWEDWYEIEAVKVKKQLQFTVEAKPFVKVAVDILDDKGQPVKVNENTMGAFRKEFTFLADPGVKYRVHVYEPKRSIVYLWDVSGSMSAFVESIENAVLKFGEEIDPDSEKVQLLPFDEPPQFLLDDWASDSYTLQTTVRNYKAPSSSYAHLNLIAATEMLAEQQGTKAAIVITDCQSPRTVNDKLWSVLDKVKPAVFTFQTSDQTSGYSQEQDDMQDWAAVAGGFYHNTRATEELDTAFEKVQSYLRRPAPYRINLTAPELKPSFIAVKDARDKSTIRNPEQDGVLLIIDASASMRENLPDGQMKVTAAKAVINDLAANYLPEGVNFGLRVFGHRGSGNCVSELMMPVAPLDPAAVQQKLMFVRSSSLGNTALAEALSFAAEDLKELSGLKRVVVLTDGEETCHGDPAAEIAKLADAGLDVTVNIVGFTLGDEKVKADYTNWVKSTGGKYFDAQDLDALGSALQEAMTPVELPKYEIYDSTGDLVKYGQVGDGKTEVESGVYTVKILDPENPRTEEVEAFETTITIDYK